MMSAFSQYLLVDFCQWDKIPEQINSRRKDLFGLMVAVCGQLAPLLLGLWQSRNIPVKRHSGGKLLLSKNPGSEDSGRGQRERSYSLQRQYSVAYFLQGKPYLLISITSQWCRYVYWWFIIHWLCQCLHETVALWVQFIGGFSSVHWFSSLVG